MDNAPNDGLPVLGCGVHTGAPETAARGVKTGDRWMAIMQWDVWRTPHRWVFAKDGEPVWSDPLCWMHLPWPPSRLLKANTGVPKEWLAEHAGGAE